MTNYINSTTMMRQNHIYPVPLPENVDDQWMIPIEFKLTGERGFPVAEFGNMDDRTFMEELNRATSWIGFDSIYPDLYRPVRHDRCYVSLFFKFTCHGVPLFVRILTPFFIVQFPGEEWDPQSQYTTTIGSISPYYVMEIFIRFQMRWFDENLVR